ncbi:MAG: hypothetical protein ACLVME_07100 [Ezakiella coagulans]|uniref:hypothetical protein n=1 Tax=Ezakiella coagulans TaxID=46507 RepID=UPI003999EF24
MEAKVDDKMITRVYMEGVIRWEIPQIFIKLNNAQSGTKIISGIIYPRDCEARCTVFGKEHPIVANSSNEFIIAIEKPLSMGAMITVRATKKGWRNGFDRVRAK